MREALGVSALTLKVVSLYRKPSALRDWLTGYKGRPEHGEPRDPQCISYVEAILGRLVIEHGEDLELEAGGVDCIVVVPSTDRPSPHPLEQVLIDLELSQPIRSLLRRGPGPLDFRLPSRDAYELADHQSESLRVLLIDDVYTTGARLNSAAYALGSAGHTVASALVIARRVNPDYSEAALAMWERQAALRFDWRTSPIITSR